MSKTDAIKIIAEKTSVLTHNIKQISANNVTKAAPLDRSTYYRKIGSGVEVGQGCIYTGYSNERLYSDCFETCAPIAITTTKDAKRILGHVDSATKPEEIVDAVRNAFSQKEIENASYIYYRGAEKMSPDAKLGQFAIDTIEQALDILGVKGNYKGQLKSGFEKIIISRTGVKLQDSMLLNEVHRF